MATAKTPMRSPALRRAAADAEKGGQVGVCRFAVQRLRRTRRPCHAGTQK